MWTNQRAGEKQTITISISTPNRNKSHLHSPRVKVARDASSVLLPRVLVVSNESLVDDGEAHQITLVGVHLSDDVLGMGSGAHLLHGAEALQSRNFSYSDRNNATSASSSHGIYPLCLTAPSKVPQHM